MRQHSDDRVQLHRRASASRKTLWMFLVSIGLNTGCALEHHKDVEVISEPPGARIEVNGDFVGCSPTVIKMLGERDGQVQMDYTVRAFPAAPEYYPQVKLFLKRVSEGSDRIPKRIFFDMRVRQPTDEATHGGSDGDRQAKRPRPWP